VATTVNHDRDREFESGPDETAKRQLDADTRWSDEDWEDLILSIRAKACTPFLGAGAAVPLMPLGGQVARALAEKYDYPFDDKTNLPRVAQYVSIVRTANTAKLRLKVDFDQLLKGEADKNYATILAEDDPHRVVADLELPLYITTNYDDLLMQALTRAKPPTLTSRQPVRQVCQWKPRPRGFVQPSEPPARESPEAPIVYHLHGYLGDIESMVLTEDDYLTFLEALVSDRASIVSRLDAAFASTTLLFLGYSLEDMNFKLLLRMLGNYLGSTQGVRHVAVQLPPAGSGTEAERVRMAEAQRTYMMKHFNLQRVKIYWGTCREFSGELRRRFMA
jgi:hypothetical protein